MISHPLVPIIRLALLVLAGRFAAEGASIGALTPETCNGAAALWGDACAITRQDPSTIVHNATEWWYENIVPYIPDDQKQYYEEPFGGATQPSNYRSDLFDTILRQTNEQGVTYGHLMGGRTVGSRAPLHRHDFGATTHVLQNYITLFLEGSAPVTYGPGESYYMPPGGVIMTAAVVPKPVLNNGTQLEKQPFDHSRNVDTNAFPDGRRVTIFVEIEIVEEGPLERFYWLTDLEEGNSYVRCNESPRYACQKEGYMYSFNPNETMDVGPELEASFFSCYMSTVVSYWIVGAASLLAAAAHW